MPSHPVKHFEIQMYYQKEPKFNGVYSRNNLPRIKDGAYVINLDEYESIETHPTALHVMIIIEKHLTMQHILIALELNIFEKKLNNS